MFDDHIQIPAREVCGRHIGMVLEERFNITSRPIIPGLYFLKFVRHTPYEAELIFYADENTSHRVFRNSDEMVSLRMPTTGEVINYQQHMDYMKLRRKDKAKRGEE